MENSKERTDKSERNLNIEEQDLLTRPLNQNLNRKTARARGGGIGHLASARMKATSCGDGFVLAWQKHNGLLDR